MMLLKSFTTDVPAILRPFDRQDKARRRKGPGGWLWIVGLLILSPAVSTASTLNYTHLSGSISSPYNDGNGGILQVNPGPYEYSGNGTNTIRIVDPRDTPPNRARCAGCSLLNLTMHHAFARPRTRASLSPTVSFTSSWPQVSHCSSLTHAGPLPSECRTEVPVCTEQEARAT